MSSDRSRAAGFANLVMALAWLRFRIIVNTLRGTRRGEKADTLARVVTVISWVILIGLLVPAAIATGLVGWFGGRALMSGSARWVLVGVQIILLAQIFVLALTPVLRSPGSFGNAARLRLLPVPTGLLHASAILSSLGDPWILALLPGLVTLPLGIASSGHFAAAGLAVVVMLLALAVMMTLATCAELAMQVLLRNRRRGELVMLMVMLAITVSGFLPVLLADRMRPAQVAVESTPPMAMSSPAPPLPTWLELSPPGQVASALDAIASAALGRALLPCATLAVMVALLTWTSSRLHRLLLAEPERIAGVRRVGLPSLRAPRWLVSPSGAIAITTWRTAHRTVVGRLGVFSPPLLVALLALVAREVRETGADVAWLPTASSQLFFAGVALAHLNLLGFCANQFAVDRAGFTLQMLSPVSELQIIRGKAVAHAGLLAMSGLGSAAMAALFGTPSSATEWLAAFLGLAAVSLLSAPLMVVLSATFPRVFDPSRVSSSAGPHVAASTIGTLALMALFAASTLLFSGGRWIVGAGWALAAMVGWTLIAAAACRWLLPQAALVLQGRRERLALVVAKR